MCCNNYAGHCIIANVAKLIDFHGKSEIGDVIFLISIGTKSK